VGVLLVYGTVVRCSIAGLGLSVGVMMRRAAVGACEASPIGEIADALLGLRCGCDPVYA
jgi:hypothetical protein